MRKAILLVLALTLLTRPPLSAAQDEVSALLEKKGFTEFLTAKGFSAKDGTVKPAKGGPALEAAKVKSLYGEFTAAQEAKRKLEPKEKDKKGLRLGLEVGTGPHPHGDDPGYKGIDDALDWDISGRMRLDGLGARAAYRHELPVVPVTPSVSFLKYADIGGGLGIPSGESPSFLDTPGKPVGGFQTSIAAKINPVVSVSASYDQKDTEGDLGVNSYRTVSPGIALTPLGQNQGKDWNFTLTFSPEYQRRKRTYVPAPYQDQEGMGFDAGGSVHYAVSKLPIGFLRPPPQGNGWVWPDSAKLGFTGSGSTISSLALRWSLETSIYITKYLQVTPGVTTTVRPKPRTWDPDEKGFSIGPVLGLDLKNVSIVL